MSDKYSDWKSWRKDDFGRVTTAADHYFRHLLSRFGSTQQSGLKILEIGFGNGQFLGWCRQRGHHVTGVETNAELLSRAREQGFACYSSANEVQDSEFDLIVMFDVLEHIPETEISAFLEGLSRKLIADGKIILRTPNGGSPFGLNNQYGDSTHMAVITRNKMQFLVSRLDFRLRYCGKDLYPLHIGSISKFPGRALRIILYAVCERLVRFTFAPQPAGVLSANLLTVMQKVKIKQ